MVFVLWAHAYVPNMQQGKLWWWCSSPGILSMVSILLDLQNRTHDLNGYLRCGVSWMSCGAACAANCPMPCGCSSAVQATGMFKPVFTLNHIP